MTSGRHSQAAAKLADCAHHGGDSELFLVEGDSAARSVQAVRDAATQAVLPLQGKPLNAFKADAGKVAANVLFRQLAAALGAVDVPTPWPATRFGRVLLLFDPDADGIHIGALMLLFFARWQPRMLADGRVWLVRAPMFTLARADDALLQAWSPAHRDALLAEAAGTASPIVDVHRHLGLGSLPPQLLRASCIDPATRQCRRAGDEDIAAVTRALAAAG